VTGAVLLGMGSGLGLVLLVVALRDRRPSIAQSFSRLDSEPGSAPLERTNLLGHHVVHTERRLPKTFTTWVCNGTESLLAFAPDVRSALARNLAGADETFESFTTKSAIAGSIGMCAPFMAWAALTVAGLSAPLVLPVWIALVGSVLGIAIPVSGLRRRAVRGRRLARRAVGCFLDLVVLALAGGFGIEGALFSAAQLFDSPISNRIVRDLEVARDSGRTPWDALAEVGREVGVHELVELAAAVSLAGTEGARVRSTLASKAATIRRHELADAETEANAVTERLFIPGVLLLLGFLIFIGYPAVSRITGGL
jgi:tight adherence protein C